MGTSGRWEVDEFGKVNDRNEIEQYYVHMHQINFYFSSSYTNPHEDGRE